MDDVLKCLFDDSGWDLNKINGVSVTYPEPLNTILDKMVTTTAVNRLPIVIPRVDSNKQLHFYLVGKNEQQTEETFSSVRAYLGTSYTDCNRVTYTSSQDSFEQSLLSIYPQGFKHITIHKACSSQQNKEDTYWVMESLNRVIEQYHQRPVSISNIKRPVGVILRHFFTAVNAHQGSNALKLLYELKNHQRLSPRNLLSLEIQALASGGQWQQVLQHVKIDDVVKGTIPRRLQKALLGSVGHESNNSTVPSDYNADILSERLESIYSLFSAPPDLEHDKPSVDYWKLWAIGAVSFGRFNAIDKLPDSIDSVWIDELKEWAGITIVKPEEVEAVLAQPVAPETSVPIAVDYLLAEFSLENAGQLLAQSVLSNFKDKQIIYMRLCEYPTEIIDQLEDINPVIPGLWTALESVYGEQPEIDSWHHLFQKLDNNCSAEQAHSALMLTIDRSEYWPADGWLENQVVKEIEGISGYVAQDTLRGVLPILMNWLEVNNKKLPADAIAHLLLLLVSDDQVSSEDLFLSTDLLLMLLSQTHSQAHYIHLIECIDMCWDKVKSPRSVDAVIDIYEILLDYPCSDEQKRLQSWLTTQYYCVNNWARLDDHQRQFFFDLASLLLQDTSGLPQIEASDADVDIPVLNKLADKLVAIYTLTEGAGRRAQKTLMERYDGLEVRLNHDNSATDALLNLADTADYFIFSSRSAAHQAFYPVSKRRKDLIYPSGKGASSIVREFINAIS
ncbi:protein DpdD [Pseudomonadales bacterium]|nr:protein DpdD [Pseudomonadales bacterium]